MRQVEDDAVGIAVFRFVIGFWRGRAAAEIGAAGIDHLLFGGVEIIDPHAEMRDAEPLVLRLDLQQRDIDRFVRQEPPASRLADDLHIERLLEKFRRLLRITDDDSDVTKLGRQTIPPVSFML